MRLCIADPPYLGRSRWYDGNQRDTGWRQRPPTWNMKPSADAHPEAHLWDDPATHVALAERLASDYDGFAIAMSRDSLGLYLAALPNAHVGVWHNPRSWPPGARIHPSWEPVVVTIPDCRRARGTGPGTRDVLTAIHDGQFIGAKPRAWTRWVLDMLGYDAETDTVDDLFPGSGAVAAEVAQGVLDLSVGESSW